MTEKERSYKEGLRKGANFDDILCSRGRHSGLFHGWQCKTGKDSFRNKIWKPVMKSLGLPDDLTPHSARHTCATLLAAGGARPEDIQRILGHSDYSVTANTYINQDASTLAAAIEKMA